MLHRFNTADLKTILTFLTRPIRILRSYRISYVRSDVIAGLTVAVVMLPQAMAYAFIAELAAADGLYAAVVGSIVGALWDSSRQLQTGPHQCCVAAGPFDVAGRGEATYRANHSGSGRKADR